MAYKNNNEHFKIHTIPLAQKKKYIIMKKLQQRKKNPQQKPKTASLK